MNTRTKSLIGLGIALLIIIGLTIWYMATHPAPVVPTPGTVDVTATPATEAKTIVDNGTYYEIRARVPGSVSLPLASNSEASVEAQASMETWVHQEIERFKDNGNFDNLTPEDIQMQRLNERKYALTIAYTEYHSPKTVSYVYENFADTLGAHPNTYYRTFTFDATTGAQLAIDDLFVPGADYLNRLSTISRQKLPAMIAEREQVAVSEVQTDMISDGTQPIEDSFQNFYLDGNNLVLVFPPYQVGPYVLGTVLLPIPLSNLSQILKPMYR